MPNRLTPPRFVLAAAGLLAGLTASGCFAPTDDTEGLGSPPTMGDTDDDKGNGDGDGRGGSDGGADEDEYGPGAGATTGDTGTTGTTGTTGGTGTTGTTGLGTTTDGGSPAEPPCDLPCAEGACIVDDDDMPHCACEPGFASSGNDCIPCEAMGNTIDLDVPTIRVAGVFTMNGQPAPASEAESGRVFLRNRMSGDEVLLGATHQRSFDVRVVPATYELIYEFQSGGRLVPRNRRTVLRTLTANQLPGLDVDLELRKVEGRFLLDGDSPPPSEYERARIVLRSRFSDDEVVLGETHRQRFGNVWVMPGDYDIIYSLVQGGQVLPANVDTPIGTVEIVPTTTDGGAITQSFDVAIDAVDLTGQFTIAGQAPPASEFESGVVTVVPDEGGEPLVLGHTHEGSFSRTVLTGSYTPYYAKASGGAAVPGNSKAPLTSILADDLRPSTVIDVPMVELSGSFLLQGRPTPSSTSDDALIALTTTAGDEVLLGNTHDRSYVARLVPGRYDVVYAQETSSGQMPANTRAVLGEAVIHPGTPNLDIDIDVTTVQGAITLNDALPPDSEYDDGRLYLRSAQGDSVLLGNTRLGGFERRVVPGDYEVVYVVETPGEAVPVNSEATLMSVTVPSSGDVMPLDIDIRATQVQGAMTVDGAPAPASGDARLFLEDVQTHDRILLGGVRAGSYTHSIASGTYLVRYRSLLSDPSLPANTDAPFKCVEVTSP